MNESYKPPQLGEHAKDKDEGDVEGLIGHGGQEKSLAQLLAEARAKVIADNPEWAERVQRDAEERARQVRLAEDKKRAEGILASLKAGDGVDHLENGVQEIPAEEGVVASSVSEVAQAIKNEREKYGQQ